MFNEVADRLSSAAVGKVDKLKGSLSRYLVLSMMAGAYVGVAVLLLVTIGGAVGASPYKGVMFGVAFGVALSLVMMTGAELFTGANMIMVVGALDRKVTWLDTINVWVVCYIGNFIGSFLLGWMFVQSGLAHGATGDFILGLAAKKMHGEFFELFFRGILCNILVCVAVYICYRIKDDTAKLIMIFWCLFAFITSGFEHCVANMTTFSMALIMPGSTLTVAGMVHNLIPVTLGNIVGGGFFMGAGYWFVGNKK
ncbi:MAG: formate/nitrite transporter family protein [Clostridia bacterium]|nr:formate/nitrite transporter family protein [Clostridia bacterium]